MAWYQTSCDLVFVNTMALVTSSSAATTCGTVRAQVPGPGEALDHRRDEGIDHHVLGVDAPNRCAVTRGA